MRIIIINLKLPLLQQGQMRNRKVACLFSYKKLGSQSVGSGSPECSYTRYSKGIEHNAKGYFVLTLLYVCAVCGLLLLLFFLF